MGKYTAITDPRLDVVIDRHMQGIVTSIVSHMKPHSIILRGSFGRGEGSVINKDGEYIFLSDYEIDVTTQSPFYRSLFADLSQTLSAEYGVQTGIRWMRPDCMTKDRIGPFPRGAALKTISLYEFKYGSRLLFGEDFISKSPPIYSEQIQIESAIKLMLNRMAESLIYMSPNDNYFDQSYKTYYWINKTILACAESLLVLWKQYHYSYQERGHRFAELAGEKLGFMHDHGMSLCELVATATEFKLQPRPGIYNDTVLETWGKIIPIGEQVFRYLMGEGFQIPYLDYCDFPDEYIKRVLEQSKMNSRSNFYLLKLLETYKTVKAHLFPHGLFSKLAASQITYSIVPLLFFTYNNENQAGILDKVRFWLTKLGELKPRSHDPITEWDNLRQQLVRYWKIYCY